MINPETRLSLPRVAGEGGKFVAEQLSLHLPTGQTILILKYDEDSARA